MRALLPVGLVWLTCLLASQASAQSLAGRYQLQTQASIFEYELIKYRYDDEAYSQEPFKATSQTVGLTPRLGAGFGYMVRDQLSLNVSATLSVRNSSDERQDAHLDYTVNRFELLPTVRLFSSGSRARMFIAAGGGYLRMATKASGIGTNTGEASEHRALFGGIVGIHGFVHDRLSIDSNVEVLGEWGSFKNIPIALDDYGADLEERGGLRGFRIVFTVGLTGWLGGRDRVR